MPTLEGKVALVTGAGRGIGRTCALALAEAGADVACIDIDPAAAAETAQAISGLGRRSMALDCDVTDSAAVDDAIDRVCRARFDSRYIRQRALRFSRRRFHDEMRTSIETTLSAGMGAAW